MVDLPYKLTWKNPMEFLGANLPLFLSISARISPTRRRGRRMISASNICVAPTCFFHIHGTSRISKKKQKSNESEIDIYGWWLNQANLKNMRKSNWIISLGRGEILK